MKATSSIDVAFINVMVLIILVDTIHQLILLT